jgi:hypothetical protein
MRAMAHRDNAAAQKEEVSRGKEETANSFIILGIELEAAQYILLLFSLSLLNSIQTEYNPVARSLLHHTP